MADAVMLPTVTTVQKGNIGAGEQAIIRYFLKGNVLRNPGDTIRITAIVVTAANANNKTTILYFGALGIATRGPAGDNNSVHVHQAWVTRMPDGSQRATGMVTNLTSSSTVVFNRDVLNESLDQPVEIKLTAQGTNDNDIVSRFFKVEYLPVNDNFEYN